MKKKGFKERCEKRTLSKCRDVCRTFDPIQFAYADILESDPGIQEFSCNVPLEGPEIGEYTSDFLCLMTDGKQCVRECVQREHLTKSMTVRLLNLSKAYWLKHGVLDWRIVTNAEK